MTRVVDGHPRVTIVTGIFPPDIGGPATHAVDLLAELTARGVTCRVVTLTDAAQSQDDGGRVRRYPRRWPWPLRFAAVVWWLIRQRRHHDVIYATGMQTEAVLAGRLSGVRVVVKFVGDPAWERGRREGLVTADFDDFQRTAPRGIRLRAMSWLRDWTVRSADVVTVPSEYLAEVVKAWTPQASRPVVILNGVRVPTDLGAVEGPHDGLRVLFVGRLVTWKRVELIVRAVAKADRVQLDIVGDGPERATLSALVNELGVVDRVRLLGSCSRDEALRRIAAADALISASSYEGLPHTVIEALAVGTPVIASPAGGTGEALVDGQSGLLLSPFTTDALVEALRRLRDDGAFRQRLVEGAVRAGAAWRFERTANRLLDVLDRETA